MHAAAEFGGGDFGQAAPAAADFEDRIAGLGVELLQQAEVLA
jgi:hypothetical protein